MTKRTVLVIMAFGCEFGMPLAVCLSMKAARLMIKDINAYVAAAPTVDWTSVTWEKEHERHQKYLERRPWGKSALDAERIEIKRVPVRWVS